MDAMDARDQHLIVCAGLVFFSLGMVIHLAYRIKTNRFTKTWLDFVVVEEGDKVKAKRIGVFYYFGVGISLALSFVLSQLLT